MNRPGALTPTRVQARLSWLRRLTGLWWRSFRYDGGRSIAAKQASMPMAQRRSQWFAPLALLLLCLSLAACTGESEPAVHTEAETPASVTVGAAATSAPADPPQVTSAAVLPSAAAPATAPPAKQQPTLALIGRLKLPFARGSVRVLGQYAFVGAAGFANCPVSGSVTAVYTNDNGEEFTLDLDAADVGKLGASDVALS